MSTSDGIAVTHKWGKPFGSRVWHIFSDDGMCLCRSWGFFKSTEEVVDVKNGHVEKRDGDCAKCVRIINSAMKGAKP